MTFDLDGSASEPDLSTVGGLVQELESQAALLVAVATGGPQIATVQAEYQRRRQRLVRTLERRGLQYPFPWHDLWQWYGHWSANLKGYGSRRAHIRQLVAPVLEALERQRSGLSVVDPRGAAIPTWADLDGRVAGLATELADAASRDDLQDCRLTHKLAKKGRYGSKEENGEDMGQILIIGSFKPVRRGGEDNASSLDIPIPRMVFQQMLVNATKRR